MNHAHRLVSTLVKSTTDEEKLALSEWATQLIAIREGNLKNEKARQAVKLTTKAGVIWPSVKIISQELKRFGWDDRSWAARVGLLGFAVGAIAIEGGAGIAAFGTAISVPLWVVFGSGVTFAGLLIEEIARERRVQLVEISPTVFVKNRDIGQVSNDENGQETQ